jgi:hypothetical protein
VIQRVSLASDAKLDNARQTIIAELGDLGVHVPTGQVPPRWFDLSASRFAGMFDFADAEIADRHLDLKYIHSFGRRFAERLMAAYENEAEVLLDRQRPAIYHVASAVSHLKSESDESALPQRRRG